MVIKKTTSITIKIPEKLVDQLNETMKKLGLDNLSDFVRGAITLRLRMEQMKSVFQDPERFRQFGAKMEEHLNEKEMFDWVATLSDDRLQGFKQLCEMEKEKRYEKFQKG